MARVYSSRVLLDPSMLSGMNTTVENRTRRGIERQRRLSDSVKELAMAGGDAYDRYIKNAEELGERQRRYQELYNYSTAEDLKDPMYRAVLEESARTGSTQPLTSYQLSKDTRAAAAAEKEANRLERARLEADKKEQERRIAKTDYLELIGKAQEALDAGKFRQARILGEKIKNLAEQHGFNQEFDYDALAEEGEREKAAQAERDEAQKALDEENERKETERQYELQRVLSTLEAKYPVLSNKDQKKAYIDEIFQIPDEIMTKAEKTAEIQRIRGVDTTQKKKSEARQSAAANFAGKKATEQLEEAAEVERIKSKRDAGIPLSIKEQQILNKYEGKK